MAFLDLISPVDRASSEICTAKNVGTIKLNFLFYPKVKSYIKYWFGYQHTKMLFLLELLELN